MPTLKKTVSKDRSPRPKIETVPLPENPLVLLLDQKSIRVLSNITKINRPGGTGNIGTWPTPEKNKNEVSIETVPMPEKSMLLVIPQKYVRTIANVKNIMIKGGTMSIGTWPTPENPKKDHSMSAMIRVAK